LRDGAAEGVEYAGILLDAGQIAQAQVESVGISAGEIGDRADAEQIEVGEHDLANAA